jgi:hypothetical protein
MNPLTPVMTNTKPLCKGTFSRWRSPGAALSACVAVACMGSLPARALDFLNNPSSWSGATQCPNPSGCVDDIGSGSYDIGGNESSGQYSITSPTATIDTFISFNYSFEPSDPSLSSAAFSLDGTTYTLLAASQSSASGPLLLTSGNSFSFRLINSGEQPILGLSNFSATPVPAPLPLLGGAATFGWIRRRRSQLKARQLAR